MICLYSRNHLMHQPPFEVFNGDHDTAQEVPERIENIKNSLERANFQIQTLNSRLNKELLNRVHDIDYLEYIESQSTKLKINEYVYPSVHRFSRYIDPSLKKLGEISKRGLYVFDTYTPILPDTYQVAIDSASLAYEASERLISNPNEIFYAMCRPPGHHAECSMAGGYCYINNAAIAAENLSKSGRVAVLDIDFHHGNGTQDIFYNRDDVFTISIHANPHDKFPHFTGFSNETGIGKGNGANLNIPLPLGTDENSFTKSLKVALEKISVYTPEYLVIAFGADTHIKDPIGGFRLTTPYYSHISKMIKQLNTPTMIVQEGGYNSSFLGEVIVSFLSGFN